MSSSLSTPQPSPETFKLILHCEDGSIPYLTPILLSDYFPTTNRIVRDHLVLGIELRNSFVSPIYGPRSSGMKNERKKKRDKTPPPSPKGSGNSSNSTGLTKPTGYTFTGRPLFKHLGIPEDYDVITCPSFDLIDNCEAKIPVAATSADVSLLTPRGYQKITPTLYRDVVNKMVTPAFIGLYDQASAATNIKRASRSVERTKAWLEIGLCDNVQDEDKNGEDKEMNCPKFWAPIVGEEDFGLRLDCIQHAANKNIPVCGFAFIGLHHVSDRHTRNTLLQSCVKAIPKNLPCAVLVANDMVQILDAARHGVRYIGSSLPTKLARSHKALVLDLHGWKHCFAANEHQKVEVSFTFTCSNFCISLDDGLFVKDTAPFVKCCSCLACTHHKRAYVHHLINAKELLAEILLFVHNLHHMLALYDEMSQARSVGKVDIFFQHIEKQLLI